MAKQTQSTVEGKGSDWWLKELDRSRAHWKTYRDEAYKVIERYRDERESEAERLTVRFNILYSNTETLKPAIYAQMPKPDVRRRFADKDPTGKAASDILQRCLAYAMDCHDFDGVLEGVRDDYVLPGFAVARIRYKPYFERDAKGQETGIAYEEVVTEHQSWDAFAMSRSKSWHKVWWVAFAEDLSKEEAKAAFGDKAEKLAYTYRNEADKHKHDSEENRARVWEVWDKRRRRQFFIAEGYDGFLREEKDPLRLEGFFPCPKPLWMLSTTGKLTPIPEYAMYRDLAYELDDITERIHVLVSALRRRGVYDGSNKDTLAKIANTQADNHFEPIEDWVSFVQRGGLKTSMEEMDLANLAQTILQLYDYRDRCLSIIYEVTGIADIIRGSSSPQETATAQAIKGKYAGMRIGARQSAFAKFARDLVRLMGEVIAERFSPQMLAMQSGVQLPSAQAKQQWQQAQQAAAEQAQMAQQQGQPAKPPQVNPEEAKFFSLPTIEDVVKLLRNDKLRGFKIDIETDSTVLQDQEGERKQRVEFLTAVAGFIQQFVPAVQSGFMKPEAARELITFAARSFRVGSQLEEALDGMGGGESPQVAQMRAQMQKKEQELAQREKKAIDDTHRAEIAGKDAQMREASAKHAEDMFKLMQGFEERLHALEDTYAQHGEQVTQAAEKTALAAMDRSNAIPQGA